MRPHSFHFFLLLHFFPPSTVASADPAFTATELILLNCGANASSPHEDASNRIWDTDEGSKYIPTYAAAVSSTSKAFHINSSVFPVPYESARVFRSPSTYNFPITTGQKFLRLYFYPDTYAEYNTSQSFFSVIANDFTLLRNFSAFLYSRNTKLRSFAKEFIINIEHSQTLRLTFSPNSNSFAFVNGIEIVSIPDKLYFKGNDVPIKYVDGNSLMNLESNTALENLYRLNVGGGRVEIENDSGPIRGMFRAWSVSTTDHVSTVVKGSLGYVDPEYYRRRQLTEKSDVYSFGVVLFEVLCGRPAIVKSLPREQANLAEWAQFCYLEGRIEQIVDANLNGQITPQCLNKFAEVAAQCVRGTGIERPSMNDVVWSLELAVRMQTEESEGGSSRDGDSNSFIKLNPSVRLHGAAGSSATDEEMFSGSKRSDFSAFSDKTNSLGR